MWFPLPSIGEDVSREPLRPSVIRRPRQRIQVIEKPGADYPAPKHNTECEHCWCDPDLFEYGDHVLITHRHFEN